MAEINQIKVGSTTYDITDANALPKSGGTLTGNLTVTNGSSAQKDEPNFKWKKVGENTPYIGFATDQTDGTFVLCSLRGTNYASGLAIGGGSTNLLWKGNRVLDNTDLTTINASISGKANASHTHNYAGSSSAGGAADSVKTALTFNNGGNGAASGTTFNGSTARTISYNTIGAAPAYTYSTTDLTAGTSTLTTGKLYFVYE